MRATSGNSGLRTALVAVSMVAACAEVDNGASSKSSLGDAGTAAAEPTVVIPAVAVLAAADVSNAAALPGGSSVEDPVTDAVPNGTRPVPDSTGTAAAPTIDLPDVSAEEECQATPVPQGLVLLSDIQFVNGIRAALGDAALTANNLPAEQEKQFSRKLLALTNSLVIARMGWAEDAGSSLAGHVSDITHCQDGDRACAQTYLEGLARVAFRRVVGADELSALMAVFDVGNESSYERGIGLAVEAIFSSPSFFYRLEVGEAFADGTLRLTPTEFASELSYLLTDAPPDAELLATAIAGTLADPSVAAAQLERLLSRPETQTNLTYTLMAAWSFGDLFYAFKDKGVFPEFEALRPRMYEETKLFLQDVLWTRGVDVSAILTSPTTFVDSMLAELYGVPFPGADPDDFVQVTLPADQRAGILTQSSLMSARSTPDRTSVLSRGIFVRGSLMCLPRIVMPDIDSELAAAALAQFTDGTLTPLERVKLCMTTSPCSTCHSQFDVFGLPLEFYDPIGRYVPQPGETIVDLTGVVGLTAGASTVSNGVELSQALAAAPQFKSCLTRHMLSYGLGWDELLATSCEVREAVKNLPETATMTDVMRAVASSPALWTRVVPEAAP